MTGRTRAIVPVHLYGQMADMDGVMEVAARHDLVVIEDAAQAIGAEYKGRRAGSIGHYGCLSFFPSKNLGAAGDGGMIVTNDGDRAARLTCLRSHGSRPKYHHRVVGGNFRLDALQAAIVSAKLPYLDAWTEARQANARRYTALFESAGLAGDGSRALVQPPTVAADRRHVFNQYVIRVARREDLRATLLKDGIATEVYYPVPMHLQDCFAAHKRRGDALRESERAALETLALPIYPELSDEHLRYVVDRIGAHMTSEQRVAAATC